MNNLKAIKRSTVSSGQINKLRSDGFIPAILYGGKQKIIKKNDKNKNEENLQQSQGLPAGWREGDSYIGRRKKARN